MSLYIKTTGEGPPLVLLHGFGFYSAIWQSFATRLSEDYQVHLLDLPGFGRSAMVDYQTESLLPFLLESIPDNAILVGWSMGGMIAQALSLHVPERFKAVITIASSPRFVSEPMWPGMNAPLLADFALRLQTNYQRTMNEFLLLQFDRRTVDKSTLRELKNVMCHYPPSKDALDAGLQLLSDWDLRDALSQQTTASLSLFGQRDGLVPVDVAKALARYQPAAKIHTIKGAAHLLFLSHLDEVLTVIKEFLWSI